MYLLEGFWREVDDEVNNMYGWFQKLLNSRVSSSTQQEKEAKVTKTSVTSSSTVPKSPSSTSLLTSSGIAPSKLKVPSALYSELRWKQKYDIFVCHSAAHSDTEEATRLVSFLEASPCNLRCFLWQRDSCPGGAISTEFCQAMQNSHLWALLITPNFVKDDWCIYMMHHALAEGPMSNRMIPLIQNLSHSQYPLELKFYYYIDLSKNPDQAYKLVSKIVLKYLEDLVTKEMILDCNTASSRSRLDGEDSPQKDKTS